MEDRRELGIDNETNTEGTHEDRKLVCKMGIQSISTEKTVGMVFCEVINGQIKQRSN